MAEFQKEREKEIQRKEELRKKQELEEQARAAKRAQRDAEYEKMHGLNDFSEFDNVPITKSSKPS